MPVFKGRSLIDVSGRDCCSHPMGEALILFACGGKLLVLLLNTFTGFPPMVVLSQKPFSKKSPHVQ